jgi:hypothetical protein
MSRYRTVIEFEPKSDMTRETPEELAEHFVGHVEDECLIMLQAQVISVEEVSNV